MHRVRRREIADAANQRIEPGEVSNLDRRHRLKWLLTAATFAVGVALIAAACGGGGSNSTTTGSTSASGSSSTSKSFANFRLAYDTGIDYLDPGLSYTVEGWAIMWNVYLPLLGYKHVNGPDGATIVPYLAEALPTVSSDGKTYTLTLRKGIKYSNGATVVASDFRSTIERDFKVDSPGVGFFSNIVGADQFSKTKTGHISGISVDDTTGKITIHLTAPQGDFMNILATTFAAPVPAGSPAKDQSTTPLPSTGPYMIQSYQPNKIAIVVRNPNYDASQFDGNVPVGNPGQDDDQHHRRRLGRSAARDQRAGRLRLPPDPAGPAGVGAVEVRRPAQGLHAGEHVLLLHEHAGEAVRQPEGPPGGQLRDQPRGARPHLRRSRGSDAERAAADVPAVREAQPVPVQPREGEVADRGVG